MKTLTNSDARIIVSLLERYMAIIEQTPCRARTTRQHNDKRLIKILKNKLTK